jgi:hypothetical protein
VGFVAVAATRRRGRGEGEGTKGASGSTVAAGVKVLTRGGVVGAGGAAAAYDETTARGAAGTQFAALEAITEASDMRAARKERKKARQQAEKARLQAEKDGVPMLESNEQPDELEQQLSISHSTADAQTRSTKVKKLKKLTADEIDRMTAKQLRRELSDRSIEDANKWAGKPDEAKQLREYAKSLASVCEGAAGLTKARRRVFDAPKNEAAELDNT